MVMVFILFQVFDLVICFMERAEHSTAKPMRGPTVPVNSSQGH